jgi:hypothetical protein
LALSGCVTSEEENRFSEKSGIQREISRRFISLRQVHKGLTRKEVASILGNKVLIGYELADHQGGQYKPVTTNNPYRVENVQKGSVNYHIDYYLKKIKVQDDIVSDDELVPLVFRDDRLVGKGWDFLKKKIKN